MIEFRNVSKQYSPDAMALRDISFTVEKGELVFLAGPSGAGKSTLLKMIAAIERPSAGHVIVNGQDIARIKPAAVPFLRRNLGLIFQQQRLLNDRTILANVMLPLLVTGASHHQAEQRARAALDKVGLADRASAHPLALSGGEQQRVSIARAIVNRPQVILADEPTANLDRASANKVLDALKAFHSVGVTCLISSHDEQMLDAAARVIHLNQGSLGGAGMTYWFRQHRYALSAALVHLRRSPGSFLFNIIVVAIALALPFTGVTLLDNVRPMSEQMSVDPEISVFLKQDTPREQAEALAAQLRLSLPDKQAKIIFNTREKALDSLKEKSGLADVLTTLGENPLPDSYVLKLDAFRLAQSGGDVDVLAEQLRALPGVDTVQVDSAWVKRLAALLNILHLALLLLAVTLGTVVVAVIFNTIRLQVMTQREEILVSKLIGATDSFIHRPFYYTGALLGLCAGGAALGVVALVLHPLNIAIAEFARLYASEFQLAPLQPLAMAGLLALSAGLGLVAALLSVQRHLSRLN